MNVEKKRLWPECLRFLYGKDTDDADRRRALYTARGEELAGRDRRLSWGAAVVRISLLGGADV